MVQGEATSRLAMTATRNMAINPITGDAVIEDEGFPRVFLRADGLKIGLTGRREKLLSTAALYLTQNNHYRPEEFRADRDGGADSADLLRAAAGLSRR